MTSRTPLLSTLPSFPWDSLASARALAERHPDGIVDLSVGTPVDETPRVAQEALVAASDAHGYPTVAGTGQLREAIVDFCRAHRGAPSALNAIGVLPTIGSKELVAHLPFQLGIGAGEAVAFPHIAYPTYDLGARLAGARPVPLDVRALAREGEGALGSDVCLDSVRLLWLNTPSNPTGAVHDIGELRALLTWARERGIIVASDECYAPLTWDVAEAPSILDERVNDGDLTNVLCAYSLSKQSNLAGYRAAFVAGDPALVGELLAVRKHSGLMVPGPVQNAMAAALGEEASASRQRETYRSRRETLAPALEAFGGSIEHSEAGLYLWTTFGEASEASIERLAKLGILAAPGTFYGEAGARHVRISLTATDERIASAAERLRAAR